MCLKPGNVSGTCGWERCVAQGSLTEEGKDETHEVSDTETVRGVKARELLVSGADSRETQNGVSSRYDHAHLTGNPVSVCVRPPKGSVEAGSHQRTSAGEEVPENEKTGWYENT